MSLRELARRVDVSASLVSQIETGRMRPSVPTLHAIVSELGLSLDETLEIVESAGLSAAAWASSRAAPARARTRRAGAAPQHRADQRRVMELGSGVIGRLTAWRGTGGASGSIDNLRAGWRSWRGRQRKLMRHSGRRVRPRVEWHISGRRLRRSPARGGGLSQLPLHDAAPFAQRRHGRGPSSLGAPSATAWGRGIADARATAAVRSSRHRRPG